MSPDHQRLGFILRGRQPADQTDAADKKGDGRQDDRGAIAAAPRHTTVRADKTAA